MKLFDGDAFSKFICHMHMKHSKPIAFRQLIRKPWKSLLLLCVTVNHLIWPAAVIMRWRCVVMTVGVRAADVTATTSFVVGDVWIISDTISSCDCDCGGGWCPCCCCCSSPSSNFTVDLLVVCSSNCGEN